MHNELHETNLFAKYPPITSTIMNKKEKHRASINLLCTCKGLAKFFSKVQRKESRLLAATLQSTYLAALLSV